MGNDSGMADAIARIMERWSPITARAIAAELASEIGTSVNPADVNTVLASDPSRFRCSDDSPPVWSPTKAGAYAPNSEAKTARPAKAPQRIKPTPQQRELIEFRPDGNLLIRGGAGAGKTTVLALRADHLKSGSLLNETVLFITYNTALAAYVRALLRSPDNSDISVTTFHAWARGFAQRVAGADVRAANWSTTDDMLKSALAEASPDWRGNHLAGRPFRFWKAEIAWIFGQGVRSRDQYLRSERVGCGSAIPVRLGDREFVWDVFERYCEKLKSRGVCDIENPAGLVRDAIERSDGKFPENERYDHVFIDEVQDFDRSWLAVLAPIARQTLTMAGDLAQRIYRRNFTWKSAGIDLHGSRSKTLSSSHRTTRQIMEIAVHLATNADLVADEDYIAPEIPDREGPPVALIERSSFGDAREAAAQAAAGLINENPNDSVVIAVQFTKVADEMVRKVRSFGTKAIVAKGGDLSSKPGSAIVTTLHQLKGLEFDHVVIVDLEDRTMPQWYLKNLDGETEEEKEAFLRRLVYVGMTRAKKSVTLAGARPLSRFFNQVSPSLFDTC